jgi:hypothetical protein
MNWHYAILLASCSLNVNGKLTTMKAQTLEKVPKFPVMLINNYAYRINSLGLATLS